MFVRDLKEAVEVEDHVQLDRKEDEDSSGNAEDVERAGKGGKVSQERIKQLKKTFRPSWFRNIVDNSENEIKGKNN
jgi:hypothetical protein